MGSTNGYFSGGENRTSFVDNLSKGLESLPPLSSDCCIYRVPNRLRGANEKSYTPQSVSIGPLHHGKEGLERMEEHKKRYLKSFLGHTRVGLEVYVAVIKDKETEIRNCYADFIDFSSEKFVEIILVDAVFVIELFLRFCYSELCDVDRIYQKPLMILHIVPDLLLLENQLPFFILEDLLEIAKRGGFIAARRQHYSMIQISNIFFKSQLLVKKNDKMCEVFSPKVLHFVDLLWKFYRPEASKGGKLKSITVPTVTKLHQAGVKLENGTSTDLLNITFKDGVLTIPTLKLLDKSEILFRNLLAFEHWHCSNNEYYLTNYFIFMQRLVKGPKDLKLLVKYGIIEHSMRRLHTLNDLVDEVTVDVENFYFASVCEEINVYCRSWHRWKANLKQIYFNTPWAILSIIAVIVLLLLTSIKTICYVYSLYK